MRLVPFIFSSLAAIGLAFTVGAFVAKRSDPKGFAFATPIEPPKSLESLRLINVQGEVVGPEIFKDHWTLLFVGYAHCPDVCPMTLGFVKQELAQLELRQKVKVAFVSMDSERDTPDSTDRFVKSFDPRFEAYLATDTQLKHLGELLGVFQQKQADGTIAHGNSIYIISPKGEWVGVYTSQPEKGRIAGDLKRITRS